MPSSNRADVIKDIQAICSFYDAVAEGDSLALARNPTDKKLQQSAQVAVARSDAAHYVEKRIIDLIIANY